MKYTREQVIDIIEELLQRPDILIDAVENENTNWDAEELLKLASNFVYKEGLGISGMSKNVQIKPETNETKDMFQPPPSAKNT